MNGRTIIYSKTRSIKFDSRHKLVVKLMKRALAYLSTCISVIYLEGLQGTLSRLMATV
jgi:hypothetical protein